MNSQAFFPAQASTFAADVDALYFTLIAISTFFTVAIAIAIFILAARYYRTHPDQTGESVKDSKWLETAWIVVPLFIVTGIFYWGMKSYLYTRTIPKDALEISVVGKRWMWKFQHPDGRREINELHIPVGKPIHVKLISQDVIHSLYVPAFRVKQDALPNFYTSFWFEATKTGTYRLLCTEYCGKDHSIMGGKVVVLAPAEYERWLSGAATTNEFTNPRLARAAKATQPGYPESATVAEGRKLFSELACVSCHRETGANGPSLQGLAGSKVVLQGGRTVVADDNYLRESILNPASKVVEGYSPVMPAFQGRISEEDVLSLIAYIKSLKGRL